MKNIIKRINETAQVNFEKAKGMLDMFNEFYDTNYSWLNKRVVVKTKNNTYYDVYTLLEDKELRKETLATSSGTYKKNGYPLLFEIYYFPDNNDDIIYLSIYPDEYYKDKLSSIYQQTVEDCKQYNKTQVHSYDYTTINIMVKNFTNDYDACFKYDDETGKFFGNC